MNYILLIIGFILIIKSSDVLVDSASSIAVKLKIPKAVIALTVIAFGTCAPELAISFNSISHNNGNIALANVLGSLIVNILLIIGLATMFRRIKVKNNTIKKELPLLVIITTIFTLIIINALLNPIKNSQLDWVDGLIMLLPFIAFIIYIVKITKKSIDSSINEDAKYGIIKSFIYLGLSLIIISFSADLIVDNTIEIARSLNISEKAIAMVVIVVGTSLPELFLTVNSVRKKEYEMAIGNIIGTNIFNICIVLGLPIIIFNGFSITEFNLIDISTVFLAALMLYIFAKSEKTLRKKEATVMLTLLIIYYIYILFLQY